jgi:hypothetical protein
VFGRAAAQINTQTVPQLNPEHEDRKFLENVETLCYNTRHHRANYHGGKAVDSRSWSILLESQPGRFLS